MAGSQTSQYRLNYSHRKFTDDHADEIRRQLAHDSFQYEEVDFSQNNLTSKGLRTVLDVCRRCPKLRVLKLYKNQIDDGGAEYLAELCKQCPSIEEMHLSHNHFTAVGVEALITAAEKARNANASPLWLRLEQNDVGDPEAVFHDLQSRLSVCARENEVRCTVRVCCKRQKVHLPFFHLQRSSRVRGPVQSLVREPREEARLQRVHSGGNAQVSQTVMAAPSRSMTPKPASTSNGVGCAWDINGVAARRFAAAGGPPAMDGYDAASDKTPPAKLGGIPGPGPQGASCTTPAAVVEEIGSGISAGTIGATGIHTANGPEVAVQQDIQKREVGMDNVDPPVRQRVAQDEANCKRNMDASNRLYVCPVASSNGDGASTTSDTRLSLFLDGDRRRRIHPKQVETGTDQFVCPLCSFVIVRPLITICSHLFCDGCFRSWVESQVNKQKQGMTTDGPVPLLPCPQPSCSVKLRKKDIMSLDKADSNTVGGVGLLRRLRNNLQIRCVHHVDLFEYSIGQDAERVHREKGITCKWSGDIPSYEEHIRKGCPVEMLLASGSAASPLPGDSGTFNGTGVMPVQLSGSMANAGPALQNTAETGEQAGLARSQHGKTRNAGTYADDTDACTPTSTAAAAATPAKMEAAEGEVRKVRYDYIPHETEKAQISLRSNDLVKVFEVTESGWAAGVRLSRETLQEEGDAGWFPAGYLYPSEQHVPAG